MVVIENSKTHSNDTVGGDAARMRVTAVVSLRMAKASDNQEEQCRSHLSS